MYDIFAQLIQEKGITPYRLSKETGISQATLSDWKRGRSEPKIDKMQKIANYLEIDVDYLLNNPAPYCYFCGGDKGKNHEAHHQGWENAVMTYGFCWPYKVRESIKNENRPIVEDCSLPLEKRYDAAIKMFKAYFSRSIESADFMMVAHPNFENYIAMLLNQSYWENYLQKDLYEKLVSKFGKLEGIPDGKTYYLIKGEDEQDEENEKDNKIIQLLKMKNEGQKIQVSLLKEQNHAYDIFFKRIADLTEYNEKIDSDDMHTLDLLLEHAAKYLSSFPDNDSTQDKIGREIVNNLLGTLQATDKLEKARDNIEQKIRKINKQLSDLEDESTGKLAD